MKNWVILVCAAVVFGCASDPATRQQVAEMEVTRMLPPSVSLSEFDSFELAPLELAAALSARPEKVEVAGELEARLKAVIDPMLAQWNSEAGGAGDRTLVIRPFVQALHVPSGASRFWAGAWAGDSNIEMQLRLVDGSSGESIGQPVVRRSASAMTGAWSVGKSDKNLLDYIADIAREYLSQHRAG